MQTHEKNCLSVCFLFLLLFAICCYIYFLFVWFCCFLFEKEQKVCTQTEKKIIHNLKHNFCVPDTNTRTIYNTHRNETHSV